MVVDEFYNHFHLKKFKSDYIELINIKSQITDIIIRI